MKFASNLPFSLLLFAVSLWLLLWGCKKLLFRLMQGKKSHKRTTFYFPIVQHSIWVLFAAYGAFYFAKLNPLVTVIIVSAILFLGRRFLQNFVVGILFRLEKQDLRGTTLLVEEEEGVIVSYGLTTVCLKSNNGNWRYIPYEKLYKEIFVRTVKVAQVDDIQTLKVDFEKDANLPQSLLEDIRRKVLLNPYVAAGEKVQVTKGKDENQQWILVNYTLLNSERSGYVKEVLIKMIRGLAS